MYLESLICDTFNEKNQQVVIFEYILEYVFKIVFYYELSKSFKLSFGFLPSSTSFTSFAIGV